MKLIKLPITDQFLWDVLNAFSSIEDAGRFIFHPARSMRDVGMSADSPIYQKYRKILKPREFSKLIYWLKKNSYIKVKNLEGKKAVMLTEGGMGKAIRAGFKAEAGKNKKRKDGKWIMIIFDIPKRDERKRGLLRSVLQNFGYKLLQKSVWVTPYDVYEKTEDMLQYYSLDTYIKIFLIEELG